MFKLNFLKQIYLKRTAFTLAEVLITLGIIGVVAAMTLPALIQNYKKDEIEKKLQKVYTVMNQAILMSEIDNGPKEYWNFYSGCTSGENDSPSETCADGVDKYFIPYLKLLKTDKFQTGTYYNVAMYFLDGSLLIAKVTIDSNHIDFFFYPNVKDFELTTFYKISDSGTSYTREGSGNKYFPFRFNPTGTSEYDKFHYGKGFEPYKYGVAGSTITKEELMTKCKVGTYTWCTALIQLNNWEIPDDYPIKF